MKKERQTHFFISLCMLAAFMLWTTVICLVDVQAIGPQGSAVGMATINRFFHNLTGVHMALYMVTDWLSLVPFGFMIGFAMLGLMQWIRRKNLRNVDHSILVLGGFYVVVMAVYFFFETFIVNYRPILIEGVLEASYPSSTTMLVMCVMPTAMMQLNSRIENRSIKRCVRLFIVTFSVFMVLGRLLSGVHWLTDIIGGALLSVGLVMMYSHMVSNGH